MNLFIHIGVAAKIDEHTKRIRMLVDQGRLADRERDAERVRDKRRERKMKYEKGKEEKKEAPVLGVEGQEGEEPFYGGHSDDEDGDVDQYGNNVNIKGDYQNFDSDDGNDLRIVNDDSDDDSGNESDHKPIIKNKKSNNKSLKRPRDIDDDEGGGAGGFEDLSIEQQEALALKLMRA